MKRAALVLALLLTGCGAAPAPVAAPLVAATLAAKADAKLTEAQRKQAVTLIAEKLYGKDYAYDAYKHDGAVFKKGKNFQGNAAWFVVRDVRATEKAGHYAFVANEYTKDDAGTYQSQYKLTGVVDLKANEVVDIKKEVEDRDPR